MKLFFHHIINKTYVEEYDVTSRLTIPNVITLLRLLLLGPMIWTATKRDGLILLSLILTFFILDNLDGYLAQKLRQRTKFGAIFDKTVDAVAMLVGFIIAVMIKMLPFWLFGMLLFKQIIQVIFASKLARRGLSYPPIYLVPGRFGFGTVTAVVALVAALVENPIPKTVLCLIVGCLLMASLIIMVTQSLKLLRGSS